MQLAKQVRLSRNWRLCSGDWMRPMSRTESIQRWQNCAFLRIEAMLSIAANARALFLIRHVVIQQRQIELYM
jgi:hypothetical protein